MRHAKLIHLVIIYSAGWDKMGYLLGIDIGTTGVKALLIDETGGIAARAFEEYPLLTPRPGWAEQEPEDWWRAVVSSIRKIIAETGEASAIAAIGLSGQMHGLVPLDGNNRPLRPAILWCDQRTFRECEFIDSLLGPRLIELVSNPALTGFTAPKLLWMLNNEPHLFMEMRSFLLPKDYVRYRLTGERYMEISDAAGTLLLDVAAGDWSAEVVKTLELNGDLFPPIAGSAEVCGAITKAVAAETGLAEGTPVVGGGADNTCAAVGTGIVHEGRVSSSIGSSGVIFAHSDELKTDPGARVHAFNHSVPDCWYLMGVMLSAGLSLKWFRDTFGAAEIEAEKSGGRDAYELLAESAADAPPGCEGLLFLPYLNGERTPHSDPFARGVFCGITPRHGRGHMIRAVMEGVVYGLKDSLDIMKELGIEPSEVRATGGGGRSPFWRQMQADAFGVPVVTVNNDEGPAFGAALLAGVGAGAFGGVAEASDATVKVVSESTPRPEFTDKYEAAHRRFRELYSALKRTFRNFYETDET